MFTKLITLSALFVSAYCLSIGTVSEKNVTKREADSGDLFPDWVPFKNKHGDELGEFVQIEKKNKVKKRLAPPINFLMRAVEETDDDIYEKGGGESDGEEYFDKKDWSDLNRPANDVDKNKVTVNHTDISDIDGVVSIITDKPKGSLLETLNEAKYLKGADRKKTERPKNVEKEVSEIEDIVTQKPNNTEEIAKNHKERETLSNNEEEGEGSDDEEDSTEKPTKSNPEEDKENEARKAKILSSVDELKERHAEEQRELSEKIQGEKLFYDEFSKPKAFSYENSKEKERHRPHRSRKPTPKPDYDEYEDSGSSEDKYKINVFRTETPPPATVTPRKKTSANARKKTTHYETGKMSVFKNPHLFMVYDDNDGTTQDPIKETNTNISNRGSQKFSSKYTLPNNDDERISLLPVDSKDEEPALFFPKRRKNRRRKTKTTTSVPDSDSTVAETVTDNYKQSTAFGATATGPDSTGTESLESSTAPNSTDDISSYDVTATGTELNLDSKGTDTVSKDSVALTDAVPASSDHKKEKDADFHKEKGGSRQHHSEHSEEHEEHGKKAYEGHHEDTKTAEGHHDKENHLGKYDDHGGVDKHHSEESGHYGDHHHEEHGKKQAKYEESGKHSKGHSTKGSHDIHKKEEYEKKVEFFEEDGDSGEEEKHGGYNNEREHSESGRFKKGNLAAGHQHHSKGELGHFEKGGHHHGEKGHKQSNGHDSHGKHGQKHFHKEGKEGGRKWIYHHGSPAKTANLVVIDRRGDQYYHGPHYYG